MVTLNKSIEERISRELVITLPFVDKEVSTLVEKLVNNSNKFRANLFYNASKCFGYQNEEDLVTISASLELLHRASLMHDDLADGSSTRRGICTLHSLYGDTFGIYVPNLLRDRSEEMLSEFPTIQKELMKVYNEICRGQIYEIQMSKSNKATWEDYERLVELKSAGLGRFALGSAYYLSHGETDEKNSREISKTGALLFQLVDDLEDLLEVNYPFSTVSVDVENGTKTAPWFFLSLKEQARLKSPEEIQGALTRPKILNKTYQRAKEYLAKLAHQFKAWLPDNNHRDTILDEVNKRFYEITVQYRERLK